MMPDTNMERERHSPQVLVDTEGLTREEWLDWRRRGIGGSDVSAIIGLSPFRTARDIYYDKLGIAAVEEDEGNWVAMEMGHLLEDIREMQELKLRMRKENWKCQMICG